MPTPDKEGLVAEYDGILIRYGYGGVQFQKGTGGRRQYASRELALYVPGQVFMMTDAGIQMAVVQVARQFELPAKSPTEAEIKAFTVMGIGGDSDEMYRMFLQDISNGAKENVKVPRDVIDWAKDPRRETPKYLQDLTRDSPPPVSAGD